MTEEDWMELGRRALRSKHWRWMPGMAWVIPPEARGAWPARFHHGRYPIPNSLVPIPDMRDDGTKGCVVKLIREALQDPCWCVVAWFEDAWSFDHCELDYPTEADALVAAIEGCP